MSAPHTPHMEMPAPPNAANTYPKAKTASGEKKYGVATGNRGICWDVNVMDRLCKGLYFIYMQWKTFLNGAIN